MACHPWWVRRPMKALFHPWHLHQLECYEAGILFCKTEGIIPGTWDHSRYCQLPFAKLKKQGKKEKRKWSCSISRAMDWWTLPGTINSSNGQLTNYELPGNRLSLKTSKKLQDIQNHREAWKVALPAEAFLNHRYFSADDGKSGKIWWIKNGFIKKQSPEYFRAFSWA